MTISGMEEPQKRLFSSSLSTAVHAEEQTVIGEETGLGAFLGAGGVGG